jgi:hypothetical protein
MPTARTSARHARTADSTFMRDKRIARDGRGRHYAPPHVGARCKIGQHAECTVKFCTCPCGHPVGR